MKFKTTLRLVEADPDTSKRRESYLFSGTGIEETGAIFLQYHNHKTPGRRGRSKQTLLVYPRGLGNDGETPEPQPLKDFLKKKIIEISNRKQRSQGRGVSGLDGNVRQVFDKQLGNVRRHLAGDGGTEDTIARSLQEMYNSCLDYPNILLTKEYIDDVLREMVNASTYDLIITFVGKMDAAGHEKTNETQMHLATALHRHSLYGPYTTTVPYSTEVAVGVLA